jgi:hypothetical protein
MELVIRHDSTDKVLLTHELDVNELVSFRIKDIHVHTQHLSSYALTMYVRPKGSDYYGDVFVVVGEKDKRGIVVVTIETASEREEESDDN